MTSFNYSDLKGYCSQSTLYSAVKKYWSPSDFFCFCVDPGADLQGGKGCILGFAPQLLPLPTSPTPIVIGDQITNMFIN